MKTYSLINHKEEYDLLFESLKEGRESFLSWQIRDDQTKNIIISEVDDFSVEDNQLKLKAVDQNEKMFNTGVVFFFVKSELIIFKANAGELPPEFKKLDEKEAQDFATRYKLDQEEFFVKGHGLANKVEENQFVRGKGEANISDKGYMRFKSENTTEHIDKNWRISSMSESDHALFETELSFIELDAEDEKYASKRAAPRARPPQGKMVKVGSSENPSDFDFYSLFDLSRGGVGFLSVTEDEFEIGAQINILGFDSNEFDRPMVAQVKAIRETDETKSLFKIGCAFTD